MSFTCACMAEKERRTYLFMACRVQMRKPRDFGALYFVFAKSLSEHLVLLWRQISNLSISAFPAVGVACELSPACPHWSHAGRRGVSVLSLRLTWCSAEGLLVSSLSVSLPLKFFSPNLKFERHGGFMGSHRHERLTWHTDTDCVQGSETNFSTVACRGCVKNFTRRLGLICKPQKYFQVLKDCSSNEKWALWLVDRVQRVV